MCESCVQVRERADVIDGQPVIVKVYQTVGPKPEVDDSIPMRNYNRFSGGRRPSLSVYDNAIGTNYAYTYASLRRR